MVSYRDCVVRLERGSGGGGGGNSTPGSLGAMVERFLHRRRCGGCGRECRVNPGVARAGKYLLLEVDRREKEEAEAGAATEEEGDDDDSREIALYPLQLRSSYTLFGHRYALLSSVHYHLEAEDGAGGHYITNVYAWERVGVGDDRLVSARLHEDEVGKFAHARRSKPDFDADAFVVALERVGEADKQNLSYF